MPYGNGVLIKIIEYCVASYASYLPLMPLMLHIQFTQG